MYQLPTPARCVLKRHSLENDDTLISFVPGIGFLVAAIVFGRFDLDEAEHARIRAELDARALATTEP